MMGHKTGLESSYERYVEGDFERFPEYQKAIPYLTISDAKRNRHEIKKLKEEKSELEKKIPSMVEDAVQRIRDDLKSDGWAPLSKA